MAENYEGWLLTTVAGNGAEGYAGDGGSAVEATLNNPFDVVFDSQGRLIFTDTFGQRIRRVDMASGVITTIAGNGQEGYSGDGGPATEAMLDTPSDVAVAADGTIYIADTENSCIRAVDPDGIIDTFAGVCGERGFGGDFGPANEALLNRPFGVAIDADGLVYISDTYNSVIRVVEPE